MKADEFFTKPVGKPHNAPSDYPFWFCNASLPDKTYPIGHILVLNRTVGHVVTMPAVMVDKSVILTEEEFEASVEPVRMHADLILKADTEDLKGIQETLTLIDHDKVGPCMAWAFGDTSPKNAMAATRLLCGNADLSFLYE